jgi:hypothetical protein
MPRILERTFWNKYQPIKNHLEPDAAWDGFLFETYGPELEYVLSRVPDGVVWTLLDCDGELIVGSGYHFVNRVGYFVTTKAAPEDAYFRT